MACGFTFINKLCVNWLLSKTVSNKKHCFPFRPVQFNSIQSLKWHSLSRTNCTTSRKESFWKSATTEKQILVDVWNIPTGWSNVTHEQPWPIGAVGLELRGVARWSKIIIPFSRKFQDSKPPNYTTNGCWNMSTCLVGGFNPFEKCWSKWIISPGRDENKKYLKPPSSCPFEVYPFHTKST